MTGPRESRRPRESSRPRWTGDGHQQDPDEGRKPADVGWSVFSYLIGGMVVYGLAGWLIGRWTRLTVLFPIGMLAGLAFAIALIIFRFSRPQQ